MLVIPPKMTDGDASLNNVGSILLCFLRPSEASCLTFHRRIARENHGSCDERLGRVMLLSSHVLLINDVVSLFGRLLKGRTRPSHDCASGRRQCHQ